MTLLVDRLVIAQKLFPDQGPLATCVFKPGTLEYSADLDPMLYDPSGARALLLEAGFSDHDGDGRLDRDGRDLRFGLRIPGGRNEFRRLADFLRPEFQRIGIHMEVQALEWGVFVTSVCNRHEFDAACLYMGHQDVQVDPFDWFHSSQAGDGGSNYAGLCDPEIDTLLSAARRATDRSRRLQLYHRFNRRLHDLQPVTLIRHPLHGAVLSTRYRDAAPGRKGLVPELWWVPAELQGVLQ
jgi:peptide/nickel transport system substrate-binding protein